PALLMVADLMSTEKAGICWLSYKQRPWSRAFSLIETETLERKMTTAIMGLGHSGSNESPIIFSTCRFSQIGSIFI
ncbi:MAG: hypothetical protein PVI94_21350, partial [Desulfobacterales bacterium]